MGVGGVNPQCWHQLLQEYFKNSINLSTLQSYTPHPSQTQTLNSTLSHNHNNRLPLCPLLPVFPAVQSNPHDYFGRCDTFLDSRAITTRLILRVSLTKFPLTTTSKSVVSAQAAGIFKPPPPLHLVFSTSRFAWNLIKGE